MPRVYSSVELEWKGDHLCLGRRKMLRIVPDEEYPGMWRVEFSDGKLSDMVNRTRAKDAAISIALQLLNRAHA
jgi:hypothetical protein